MRNIASFHKKTNWKIQQKISELDISLFPIQACKHYILQSPDQSSVSELAESIGLGSCGWRCQALQLTHNLHQNILELVDAAHHLGGHEGFGNEHLIPWLLVDLEVDRHPRGGCSMSLATGFWLRLHWQLGASL